MIGDKRRDLYRFGTPAVALLTLVLVILHFRGRGETVDDARAKVATLYEQGRNATAEMVEELRGTLALWNGEADWPPFAVGRIERRGETAWPVMVQFGEGATRCWVQTFVRDTDPPQEAEFLLGGGHATEEGFELRKAGRRGEQFQVTLTVSIEDPDADEGASAEVEVLLRRGVVDVPQERTTPVKAIKGEGPSIHEFAELKGLDPNLRVRQNLVFRVQKGAPAVRIAWKAVRRGADAEAKADVREVAIGILKEEPERVEVKDVALVPGARPEDESQWVQGRVKILARPVFVVGYVPLAEFVSRLKAKLRPETAVWGERIYLTNESGIVADAIPDFPEEIRDRLKSGRAWLTSTATERLKAGSDADTETYDGFAIPGDTSPPRVIGAFGRLPAINGGLIVEREEAKVVADYRGLKAWHVSVGLLVILLLVPLVPPIVRRVREDTEIPRLLHHAKGFVPFVGAIVLASAFAAALQGVMGYQTKVVMDEVILSGSTSAYERLTQICWLLAGLSVLMFVFKWVKEYLGKVIQNRMVVQIRQVLAEKLVHLPMSFHARYRSGDLLSRVGNDVAETSRGLEMLFGDIISDPITMLVLTGTCFAINWRLALVVFFGLPVILIPVLYFGRVIKKSARKRQARKADVTHTISQMLSGIRVVKAFRMEDHEAKRLRTVSESYLAEALSVARAQVTSKELLEMFNYIATAAILGIGGYLVLERQVTVGDLTAISLCIGQMYRASKNLTTNYNKLQESLAGTERIFEIFDSPDTMADRPTARALLRPRKEIAFDNVSFRYSDDAPWVLRNVSFRVDVGTSVALVGATGAGKSTMLDLVARFYDPQEGRVAVDGMDLRDFSRDSLLGNVAVVTQEAFLFNASIAENLRYGRPGASQTEIEAATRAAFVHDEILKQAEGYETNVGERGGRLSGGQRQRVTIARAILKDAPILLLDEATSALDSRSEKMVQDALQNLMKGRTTFVIAHRLSTIQHVDRILVIENGTIVEQGSHRELLELPGGHYRKLYEIQFASALRKDEGAESAAAG